MKGRRQIIQRGLTSTEMLVIVGTIALLLVVLLPALAKAKAKASRVACINNVKQIGLAFRIWANDHGNRFPWLIEAYDADKCPKGDGASVCGSKGAPLDAINDGNLTIFRSVSNEIHSPLVLVCGVDWDRNKRGRARSFDLSRPDSLRSPQQISYGVGLKAGDKNPETILTMDRNVTGGAPAAKRRSWAGEDATKLDATFDDSVHRGFLGNIGLADGSAYLVTTPELRQKIAQDNKKISDSTVFQLPE